jgi:membrane protein YqaA with SNARE-associated domain
LLWELQQSSQQSYLLWFSATLGNTLGGLSSWLIGWWLGKKLTFRDLNNHRQQQALRRINRYGSPVLLLSWLPLVGDPLCLAAGWSGIRLTTATFYIGLGKALRYATLIWVADIIV